MRLKFRIIEGSYEQFRIDQFHGFWIFGEWVSVGFIFMSLEAAEKYVMHQETAVPNTFGKVVREYTIKV